MCYEWCMNTGKTYHAAALVLTMVFGVYNIGIPIVLASCPMPKAGPMCCVCYEPSAGTASIGKAIDSSCCATVIAAERNTNAFLQAKDSPLPLFHGETLMVLPLDSTFVDGPNSGLNPLHHSLPLLADIPVLHSALLI